MDNKQILEKQLEQQLCDNPLDFEGCLRQSIEVRKYFGALTPLPEEILFAREKCFFWIFHEVEKVDLPIDSISWICQQKYSCEELLSHTTTLQQYFPKINSYVTSFSLLLKTTTVPLDEEEYKIVALFFFQTYSELTCLNALEILYVNVQFISICRLISSNTEQIQGILSKISGYLSAAEKDQLDAIAEELNQAAYELDQEDEQRILGNKRKHIESEDQDDEICDNFHEISNEHLQQHLHDKQHKFSMKRINKEEFKFDESAASITNEDAYGGDEDSMNNEIQNEQQISQKINNNCCSGMEKAQACCVEQPMVSGEQLQDSSELITALYMNSNTNNLNTNNSFFESGVFSSSQQLNELDLKTDHSNTTANSNYNSNNINGQLQLNKGQEISQESYSLLQQQQQQQQQFQQRIFPLLEGNHKQTSIQSLSMQQLPTAFTLDGDHMQEE